MSILQLDRTEAQGFSALVGSGSKTPVGVFPAGTRLYFQAFLAASAPIVHLAATDYLDGPYVRITPVFNDPDSPTHFTVWTSTGQGSASASRVALSTASLAPPASMAPDPFAFDVDLGQPIFLPYKANVDLFTVRPGFWRITGFAATPKDLRAAEQIVQEEKLRAMAKQILSQTSRNPLTIDPSVDNECGSRYGQARNAELAMIAAGSQRNTLLRHTRWLNEAISATREFSSAYSVGFTTWSRVPLPFGTQEFEFDGAITALTADTDSEGSGRGGVAIGGAFGTLNAPLNGVGNRRSIGNIQYIKTTSGAGTYGRVIFWISLT